MPGTPAPPTTAQLYADLPFTDQCVPVAIGGLIDLLRDATTGINAQIAYTTAQMSPDPKIPGFKDVFVAPESLTDEYINSLIVAWSLDPRPMGTQAYLNTLHVTITDVQRRAEIRSQVDAKWYRVGIIRTFCNWFRAGYADSRNRMCWVQLDELGVEALPDKEFYGVSLHLQITQGPGVNNWI